jgi:hypothetical protein
MDVHLADANLARTCNRRTAMVSEWGEQAAEAIGQHLQELEAVETLADLAQLPHVRVTHDGVDGRARVQGTKSGVQIGLHWDTSDQSDDPESSWGDVTVIVVESVVVDRGESHD